MELIKDSRDERLTGEKWEEWHPFVFRDSLRAALQRAEAAESALCSAREALGKISDYDWVKGGRIVLGNADLPGDAGTFYRGYNAGIKGQF